jgi:ABC-type oligopeptide transport system substrate-binding subunit
MDAQSFRALLCVAILSFGCTKKVKEPLELRIHHPKVDIKLDPHAMEDAYSMMINSQLYRGLFRYNPTGDVLVDLVDTWTESADRTSYKFKLKPTTFSNGDRITAKNVQLSFARLFLVGAAIGADVDYIKGAKLFTKTKNLNDLGIKVISDDEVEFALSFPSVLFIKHMAVSDCAIFNLKSLSNPRELPDGFSGPYKLESSADNRLKLTKWRKDPFDSINPPEKIIFFGSSENPVELAMKGETDTLDNDPVSSKDQAALEAKSWGAVPTVLTSETYIVLNPKYVNLEARKYLASKVSSEDLIREVAHPIFKPAYGFIPKGFPGEMEKSDVEAVEKTSYSGKSISFKLDYDPDVELEVKIIKYLTRVWTHDKIAITLNPMSKAEKLRRLFGKISEAVVARKGMDYPDGISVLTYFRANYDANYFHISDTAVDKKIDEAMREFDTQKRISLYKETQNLALKHHTTIPLMFGTDASGLWSHKVKRIPSHPMGYHTMLFETIEMRAD